MLEQGLNWLLDEEKLRALCSRLGVAYDELPGTHKQPKLKGLLARSVRENRALELVQQVHDLLVEWGEPVPDGLKEVVASGQLELQLQPKPPARFECDYVYTIYGSGDVVIDTHGPRLCPCQSGGRSAFPAAHRAADAAAGRVRAVHLVRAWPARDLRGSQGGGTGRCVQRHRE